ncbi:MBL fold metallo-hydrolase [Mycobacteroides abscessus]
MRVHHLNCGSLSPVLSESQVCHVLLLETNSGLVLVDTGFGRLDVADPKRRVGSIRHLIRPHLVDSETAATQLIAMGFQTSDVRHIVATHLDLDHIGGVADFPHAMLHTTADEIVFAYSSALRSRLRYRRSQLPSNRPSVVGHPHGDTTWRGFANVTQLSDIDDGLLLIPMPGHTKGHACVGVDAGHRWILHCGDAFYHRNTLQAFARAPLTSRLFERATADSFRHVRRNHAALRSLHEQCNSDLCIVSAHDYELYRHARHTS